MLVLNKRGVATVNLKMKEYDITQTSEVADKGGARHRLPTPKGWVDGGNLFAEKAPDVPVVFKRTESYDIFQVQGAETLPKLMTAYDAKQNTVSKKLKGTLKGNFDAVALFVDWTKAVGTARSLAVDIPAAHTSYHDVYPELSERFGDAAYGRYRDNKQYGGGYAQAG